MLNKKSQIGQTLTLIPAIFIIFFIMLLYLLFFGLLLTKKSDYNEQNVDIIHVPIDPVVTNVFYSFLNSHIEYLGENRSIYDSIIYSINNPNEKNDKELIFLINKRLDFYCNRYRLLIPQGFIDEKGLRIPTYIESLDNFADTEENLGRWTRSISYNLKYNEEPIEIKFRILKSCLGEGEIKVE
ncbi:MAG: hypothetical protein WC867_06875 [Candidatus Pacearchaeota archaeon]|jgi:hypothetical protein